jgi:DNA-binding IscR family transcriptional regulator
VTAQHRSATAAGDITRQRALYVISEHPEGVGASFVAAEIGRTPSYVRGLLATLSEDGTLVADPPGKGGVVVYRRPR